MSQQKKKKKLDLLELKKILKINTKIPSYFEGIFLNLDQFKYLQDVCK